MSLGHLLVLHHLLIYAFIPSKYLIFVLNGVNLIHYDRVRNQPGSRFWSTTYRYLYNLFNNFNDNILCFLSLPPIAIIIGWDSHVAFKGMYIDKTKC